jgi:cob(I)alamin adenosyltransferase
VQRGLVQVYTGNGKGKTTAAIGLMVRAVGRRLRCCVVQFLKWCPECGEMVAWREWLARAGVEWRQFGRRPKPGEQFAWVNPKQPLPEDLAGAEEGFEFARQAVNSGSYDLVVLDEINVAVAWGLVQEERVLELVRGRPDGVEVVLTGRGATENLLAAADLVTEMREVKQPYHEGTPARVGIEC